MRGSASQVATFGDCQRKWAWRAIAKIETPPNPSAELGIETHAQLENYVKGGSFDFTKPSGEIAASGIEHLPEPNTPGMLVEEEFHFEGPSGHTYMGYVDLELPPSATPDGVPTVIDHKTTSDLKWQKTAEDLRTDPQAILYAVSAFSKYPEAQAVDLKWIYYQTKRTRKSAVTHLRLTPEEVLPVFERIEAQMEVMAELYERKADPLTLPPTPSHCSAYGGCSYQGHCNLPPFPKLRSLVSQGTNSLLAKLKAQRDAGNKSSSTGPAINPPEYVPYEAAVAPPAPPAVPAAPAAEEPKKKLGRPKKEPVPPATTRPAPAPAPETGLGPAPVDQLPTRVKKIGTLFVNCAPVGHAYVDGSTFILAAMAKLRAAGVTDYRYVDFGKGKGALAEAVASELDAQLGPIEYVVLDAHSPEGIETLMQFIERAALVVR